MTREYHCEYFLARSEGASLHVPAELATLLNRRSNDGWTLEQLMPVNVGFLLVFRKPS